MPQRSIFHKNWISQTSLNGLPLTNKTNKLKQNYFNYVLSTTLCLCQIPEVQELQTAMGLLTEIFDTEDVTVFALEFAMGWSIQQIKDSQKEGSCLH